MLFDSIYLPYKIETIVYAGNETIKKQEEILFYMFGILVSAGWGSDSPSSWNWVAQPESEGNRIFMNLELVMIS